MIKGINGLLLIRDAIATMAAEIYQYGWDADFCKKYLREKMYRYIEYYGSFDIQHLTESEAISLGFHRWDDALWLIPLWMLPFLEKDQWVFCIGGEFKKIGDVDNDNRSGMLAYGIIPNPD
jgi:hypothetical protein